MPADVVALQSRRGARRAVNPARPVPVVQRRSRMRETTALSRYHGLLTAFRWNAEQDRHADAELHAEPQPDRRHQRPRRGRHPAEPARPRGRIYADARTDRRHIFTASYIYELPFFRDSSNAVAEGTPSAAGRSPASPTPTPGQPVPAISVRRNNFRRGGFADLVGHPIQAGELDQRGTPNWFNPAAFAPPADGTFGNSGRAPFRQPGFYKWDLTLSKNFYPPKACGSSSAPTSSTRSTR